MGRCLEQCALPLFCNFTPEQLQNPEKTAEYLEKLCCQSINFREAQITAAGASPMSTQLYLTLFSIHYSVSTRCSASGATASTPMTDPEIAPIPATGLAVPPSILDTAAAPNSDGPYVSSNLPESVTLQLL